MPYSRSTFLNYLDSVHNASDSKEFGHLLDDFFKLNYPDLDFCILEHVYAPECYQTGFGKEHSLKYVEMLKKENYRINSERGEFLKVDDLLIYPLDDLNNRVKLLIICDSCPGDIIDDLSTVMQEIKEVFRLVSAQTDANSLFINSRMVNLVSRISHDFNSLIALIPKESAKDKALNARIKYSEILSREIMYYLREVSVDKSKVLVKELLSAITSGISIPENIDISLKFINKNNSLSVDVELIDRALSEIINNAIFATGIEGGNIDVVVGKIKNVSPFIEFDWLEIKITDTGPGIEREFLNEVRKPFFTTWKNQGHVGLGLSIAEKIIEAHNGYLQVESKPEEGATVSIHLPLS
jgi:signal transduction histidine kinase